MDLSLHFLFVFQEALDQVVKERIQRVPLQSDEEVGLISTVGSWKNWKGLS